MSVFGIIRRGRQAAKDHNAKQAEKQKKEADKTPYRHVPTHAAVDALSGAPSGWRHEDRPKILEQNRRRSALAASGMGRGMGGVMTPVHMGMPLPRVNSALSHVSYPSVYASPVVQMPRNYSYSSLHRGWNEKGGDVVYSQLEQGGISSKGKEVERVLMVDSGRASQISSKETSPVGSSSNSTSSQDDLEMKPVKRASGSQVVNAADVRPMRQAGDGEQPHRLHPRRRVSDPPVMTNAYPPQPRMASAYYPPSASSSRPMPSGIMTVPMVPPSIPPVPALPPLAYGSAFLQSAVVSSSAATSSAVASTTGSSTTVTVPTTPKVAPLQSFGDAVPDFAPMAQALTEPSLPVGTAVTTPALAHKNRRISKTTRFTELETINPNISSFIPPIMTSNEKSRASVDTTTLPTEFDESIFLPARDPSSSIPHKTNKLSKSSKSQPPKQPKPVKKNRWSLRSSKPAAVAV